MLSVQQRTQAQDQQSVRNQNTGVNNGWNPLVKIVVPAAIAFAGIAAAYWNSEQLQTSLREQYAFSAEDIVGPLARFVICGIAVLAVGIAGLPLYAIYIVKRNREKDIENPVIDDFLIDNQVPVIDQSTETVHKDPEAATESGEHKPESSVDTQSSSEMDESEEDDFLKNFSKPAEEPTTTSSNTQESSPPLSQDTMNLSDGINMVDDAISSAGVELDAKEPLTVETLNSAIKVVVEECTSEKAPIPFEVSCKEYDKLTQKYDLLHKKLNEAAKLIASPDTKAHRKDEKIVLEKDDLMSDYKSKLEAFYDFADSLTDKDDKYSQELLLKCYSKLLRYSTLRVYILAINCVGRSAEGCKRIVQRAFKDLMYEATNKEDSYNTKYKSAKNPENFEKQFGPLTDKIRQYAADFIIECMKQNHPDLKPIIEEAFPLILARQSSSALNFAIKCYEQKNEEYRKKIKTFEKEIEDLKKFEDDQFNKKILKRTTLMSLTIASSLEELFKLKDKTIYATPELDEISSSSSEHGTASSDEGSGSFDDFNDKISGLMNDLNSSSEEEVEATTATSSSLTLGDI